MNPRKLAPAIRPTLHAAILLPILLILLSIPAHAQVAGGTIQGTILDSTGGAVPGVQVSIKNIKTNVVTIVTTNDDGLYTAPNLLPGDYEITAQATNFAMTVAKNVDLNVGAQLQVNLTMKPGTITEVVEVQDLASTIDFTTSTLGNVVDSTTVRELPLNGRDWTQLATLETGVNAIHTQVGLSTGPDRGNRGFGAQLTISGGRPAQNNYRLDGVSINDYSNGAPGSVLGSNLGVDAVEEFSVLTSNYSAEYGRTSGGVVNAVTKSGTNLLHGTAYEFLRNSALDARNYFDFDPLTGATTKAPFKRNQFGASAGGPLIKDRTFIFGDYEGDRQATNISQPITVPNKTAWDGLSPADGPVSPQAAAFRPFFPVPDLPCTTQPPGPPSCLVSTTSVVKQVINENYFTVRGDHKLTSKDSLVGTYVYDNAMETQPDILNVVLTGNSTKRQIVTAEETHTITPTVINTFRFGFNRVAAFSGQNATAINPLAKAVGDLYSAVPGRPAPGINIAGGIVGFPGGLGASPTYRFHWNSFQLYDDAFWTKGIQFIRFGFAAEIIQDNILASSDANGVVRFASLQNFFSNVPGRFDAALPGGIKERQIRQQIFAGYIQDDVRWKPNLTINLGLRYEMATVPTDVHGYLSTLINPSDAAPHLGDPFFLNPTYRNFAPRVGFAWDPFKTGKTSVRGGFGMFDILPLPYLYELLVPLSAPFYQLGTSSSLGQGSFPNCNYPRAPSGCQSMFDVISLPSNLRQAYVQHNPKRNYDMQWNLNVQRELFKNVTGMVAYVGSRTVHNAFRADDINTTIPITPLSAPGPIYAGVDPTGSPLGTFLNPNAGQISSVLWNGDAHYNALQAKLTARVGAKLQAQASYTWGNGIDTGSSTVGGDTFLNSISSLPYFNPRLNRGRSDFNITHNFVFSYTWVLPSPHDLPTALNWTLGGWQLGGVVQLSTGIPFTVTIDPNTDPLGLGSTDTWDFPDRLKGAGCGSLVNSGSVTNYVRTPCFTVPTAPASFAAVCFQEMNPNPLPPAGQITCTNRRGNLGRNTLTGPPLRNIDFSIFKNIPVKRVSETFNIQFRTEIFNLFNHPNFSPPLNHSAVFTQGSDPTQLVPVPGAGQIDTTVTSSRQIQFGLKFVW